MSQIAESAGIARATLYRYFSSVEAILAAWHERQVARHLVELNEIKERPGNAAERLEAVLEAYASILYEHHGSELAALLHRGEHVGRARHHLRRLIGDLLSEAAAEGHVRGDVAPDDLASYCIHALAAASGVSSRAAVGRLISLVLAGLHRQPVAS
jgi:AcrR family transcriptional regulator